MEIPWEAVNRRNKIISGFLVDIHFYYLESLFKLDSFLLAL